MLRFLKHPLTRDLDIDDPRTTALRKQIIKEKPFLRRIYEDWYSWIASNIPKGEGGILELGSGAGFLDDYIPGLITTEVFFCPYVRMIMDGCVMPFRDSSLKAIVMVDVFHHIPDSRLFLNEAVRCVSSGGKILMIEPWVTTWSCFVYKYLHHEPFDPQANQWNFSSSRPLSGANSALPWIVFERDRTIFENFYNQLIIEDIIVEMPFRYLLSGGVSLRSFMPNLFYGVWNSIEHLFSPWNDKIGMFGKIILRNNE